jgi:hypothetical protein
MTFKSYKRSLELIGARAELRGILVQRQRYDLSDLVIGTGEW